MALTVDDIEQRFHIHLPAKHKRALLNLADPIHNAVELLFPDGNECESIFKVNQSRRELDWKEWPEYLIAFATQGCGDYFCYDVRQQPYPIYYLDPIGTVAESVASNERDGFVFASFDDWYRYQVARTAKNS